MKAIGSERRSYLIKEKQPLFFRVFEILLAVLLLLTLLDICIFDVPPGYVYGDVNSSTVPNAVLALIGACLILAATYVFLRKESKNDIESKPIRFLIPLLLAQGAFFVMQLVIAKRIFFHTGWDMGTVQQEAIQIANEGLSKLSSGYFLDYPNNILLAVILSATMKISMLLGVDPYFGCTLLNICLIDFAGLLTAFCAYQTLGSKRYALMTFLVFQMYIGFSPWMLIPYSDTIPMFLPVLCFYLYLTLPERKHPWISWFFLCGFAVVGACIKPQCLIALIAIFILHFIDTFSHPTSLGITLKRLLSPALSVACIALLLFGGLKLIKVATGKELDTDRSMPYTHFLMMGLNDVSIGGYYTKDVAYTRSFQTAEEKKTANWAVIRQRVEDFGVAGLARFYAQKQLVIYNNGTFAWKGEGYFFETEPEKTDALSGALQDYYIDGDGYTVFVNLSQATWVLLLLLLVLLGALPTRDHFQLHAGTVLMILGISAFTLLFESRARYLLCYAPFFVLGAVLGLRKCAQCMAKRKGPKV